MLRAETVIEKLVMMGFCGGNGSGNGDSNGLGYGAGYGHPN